MKVSKYWKKALYSSVVLGAIFVGGQYLSSVQVRADTTATQDDDQSNYTQIRFTDATTGYEVIDARSHNDSTNGFEVDATVGQKMSLVNAKTVLKDMGYDVSNIPDTYTPTTPWKEIYPVPIKHISVENKPSNLAGPNNLIFEIRDQNGNYLESKYDSTDGNGYSLDYNFPIYYSTGKKIVDALSQESNKFFANKYSIAAEPGINPNPFYNKSGDNIVSIPVVTPTHSLTINYVNQNGITVFKTFRRDVTYYGHTDFYDDASEFTSNNCDGIHINPDQPLIPNTQSTATVNVTTDDSFQVPTDPSQVVTWDYGYANPVIIRDNDYYGPDSYAFRTTVNFVGADGKQIASYLIGSGTAKDVDISELRGEDSEDGNIMNFDNVTDFPSSIDLTKGPYTFHSTDTLSSLQSSAAAQSQAAASQQSASSSQDSPSSQSSSSTSQQPIVKSSNSDSQQAPVPKPAPVVQSHPAAAPASTAKAAPAPQPAKAKPSKSQLKAVAKSYKQSKHAVKTDTVKLKALKKKMKKHATKKQKAAYKSLQIKLAADKKAVKSYKAQEGKLTKYFKEVSIINRDNKQIKSLTAQLKKLKKKHSKANKKKAAKVQKALKKANNSLKAATKFVNDYK